MLIGLAHNPGQDAVTPPAEIVDACRTPTPGLRKILKDRRASTPAHLCKAGRRPDRGKHGRRPALRPALARAVPCGTGGGSDVSSRIMAEAMPKLLGQSIIIT